MVGGWGGVGHLGCLDGGENSSPAPANPPPPLPQRRTVNGECESLHYVHAEVTPVPPRRAHTGENPATAAAAAAIIFLYVLPRSQQQQAGIGALKGGGEQGRFWGPMCSYCTAAKAERLNERALHPLGQFNRLFISLDEAAA